MKKNSLDLLIKKIIVLHYLSNKCIGYFQNLENRIKKKIIIDDREKTWVRILWCPQNYTDFLKFTG